MSTKGLLKEAMVQVASHWRAQDRKMSAFLGLRGHQYRRELMVVGRAVNGWTDWTPDIVRDKARLNAFVDCLGNNGNGCPLAWVCEQDPGNSYNARRSAFWRTARKVLEDVTGSDSEDEIWASQLAWSNLYKISLKAGNPQMWMINAQEDACIRLLREEIRQFRPKRVLFSTGWDWVEPFLGGVDLRPTSFSMRQVHRVGRLPAGDETAHFVVATHPMTKPEAEWVSEVVSAFRDVQNS